LQRRVTVRCTFRVLFQLTSPTDNDVRLYFFGPCLPRTPLSVLWSLANTCSWRLLAHRAGLLETILERVGLLRRKHTSDIIRG